MILRRITDAFRRQDWFTVFIETLIVVLGVFLGLQVNNWNEARKDRIEAETSRERLIADLHADLDAFAVRRQWYEEVQEAALRVDDALRSEPPETVDQTWRFVLDSWIAGGEWPFAPSAQIYKELQNAGELDLIASGSLQRRLRDYYEDSANEIEISLTFKSAYGDLARQLIKAASVCTSLTVCQRPVSSPACRVQTPRHSTKTVRGQKILRSLRAQPQASGSRRRSGPS